MGSTVAPDLLARRARLDPEAPALAEAHAPERWTSFADWDARVQRTAHALAALGVGRGRRVALLAANHPTWLDVWLACGRLGAALVPLNLRLPAAPLRALVERSRPTLLIHDARHAERAAEVGGPPRLGLDALEDRQAELSTAPLEGPPPRLEDPWVLCGTGGSTGLPKLAVLTHANLLWNAMGTAATWGLHPGARALLNAPLFHTGGMNVLTLPLLWAGGASVVSASFDPAETLELVARGAVTHFFGVPTMFDALLRQPRFQQTDFGRVELVISGGAPCPRPIFDAFWARGVLFRSGYGLTEAGPNNFWLPDRWVRDKPGAVGHPLLHVEARVEAAPGEVGELLLRGPHVTSGYIGDPDATRAALDDEGWLHTGDLARQDEDGAFWISGRAKDMYISGGENVYPAEVESALRACAGVAEAAVIGVPHPKWGEVGRAFVVKSDPELDADTLDARLVEHLAKYQRPAEWRFVDALPVTGAGKIDRGALDASPLEDG